MLIRVIVPPLNGHFFRISAFLAPDAFPSAMERAIVVTANSTTSAISMSAAVAASDDVADFTVNFTVCVRVSR